tara:strand:- start:396 stop:497 length:102 start_codon:yes stop_codon:yes gene_type:complete
VEWVHHPEGKKEVGNWILKMIFKELHEAKKGFG